MELLDVSDSCRSDPLQKSTIDEELFEVIFGFEALSGAAR